MLKKTALILLISASVCGSLSAQMAMPEIVSASRSTSGARHVPADSWKQSGSSAESPREFTAAPDQLSMRLSPNPSGDNAQLDLNLPYASQVSIELIDRQGQLVRRVYQGQVQQAGHWNHLVQLGGLTAGMYFVRLRIGNAYHNLPLIKL